MSLILRNIRTGLISHARQGHNTSYKQYISQRLKAELTKHSGYASGSVILQRIGSAPDSSPSLVLQTPNQCYLFNCSENIYRTLESHGIPPSKVTDIFLTQKNWSAIGGVREMLECASSFSGAPPNFYGPADLFKCLRRIGHLSTLGVAFTKTFQPNIVNDTGFHEDANVHIDKIPIASRKQSEDDIFSYLCRLKALRGEFTEDVRYSDREEVNFLIVDIPAKSFLDGFVSNEHLNGLLANNGRNKLDFIVHFTPMHIYQMEQYRKCIAKMDAKREFVLNDSSRFTSIRKIHETQARLHSIDKDIHPLLSVLPLKQTIFLDSKTTQANCASTQKEIDRLVLYDGAGEEQTKSNEQSKLQIFQTKPRRLHDAKYPHIVFLGTGSASSVHRGQSAILVNLSKKSSILLDCGEGTCAQIARLYGPETLEIHRRLKGVFISHMHTDHFMGLSELLRMRKISLPAKREPLHLIGPAEDLKSWLLFYAIYIERIADINFIDSLLLRVDGLDAHSCASLGIDSFRTCRVPHFATSCAASLTFPYEDNGQKNTFKLTYSGDTVPCEEIIELGRDSTLLIHESTVLDKEEEWAAKSKHSTVSQAVNQGRLMNAKYTMLTHFSRRYREMPWIRKQLPENVGVAFDFMHVAYDDLQRLNSLIPKYLETFNRRPMEQNHDKKIICNTSRILYDDDE